MKCCWVLHQLWHTGRPMLPGKGFCAYCSVAAILPGLIGRCGSRRYWVLQCWVLAALRHHAVGTGCSSSCTASCNHNTRPAHTLASMVPEPSVSKRSKASRISCFCSSVSPLGPLPAFLSRRAVVTALR